MSSTQTSQTTSGQRGASVRLRWVGLLAIIAAVVVNTIIALVARGLFPVAPTFLPLQPVIFLSFTVLGVLGAIIVFAQIERRAKHPMSTFQRTVWIVLLVSLIPDLLVAFFRPYPGTTLPEVGALMLMHVATAMICLGTLSRVK